MQHHIAHTCVNLCPDMPDIYTVSMFDVLLALALINYSLVDA